MGVEAWPELVLPADLIGFPGAPFTPSTVGAAANQIRRTCGWHIAPELTETLTVDHDGSTVLHLPSLKVSEVTSVRDVTGSTPREITGWRWSGAGMVSGHFPRGFRSIEITLTHGYSECPPDLLPVVASRTQRRAMQESLGSRSVSYSSDGDQVFESALDAYRLGPRP